MPIKTSGVLLEPVSVGRYEAIEYLLQYPIQLRFAQWWARYMPRGKGWVPQKIGALFCRDMKVFILTKHGARLAVAPRSLDVYTTMLRIGRTWNPHVLSTCRRFLNIDSTFYDIGSNVGYFSIELCRLFDQLTVVAFEPQPDLARILAVSALLNDFKGISVFNVMIGSEEGVADLYVPSHSIHASIVPREKDSKMVRCRVVVLDRLVQDKVVPPPDFIKIDVEGAELEVFNGAKATIAIHTPYILFEADENMDRFGNTRGDLFKSLSSLAPYAFYYVFDGGLLEVTENNQNDRQYSDILAVPRDKVLDCKRRGII